MLKVPTKLLDQFTVGKTISVPRYCNKVIDDKCLDTPLTSPSFVLVYSQVWSHSILLNHATNTPLNQQSNASHLRTQIFT